MSYSCYNVTMVTKNISVNWFNFYHFTCATFLCVIRLHNMILRPRIKNCLVQVSRPYLKITPTLFFFATKNKHKTVLVVLLQRQFEADDRITIFCLFKRFSDSLLFILFPFYNFCFSWFLISVILQCIRTSRESQGHEPWLI